MNIWLLINKILFNKYNFILIILLLIGCGLFCDGIYILMFHNECYEMYYNQFVENISNIDTNAVNKQPLVQAPLTFNTLEEHAPLVIGLILIFCYVIWCAIDSQAAMAAAAEEAAKVEAAAVEKAGWEAAYYAKEAFLARVEASIAAENALEMELLTGGVAIPEIGDSLPSELFYKDEVLTSIKELRK